MSGIRLIDRRVVVEPASAWLVVPAAGTALLAAAIGYFALVLVPGERAATVDQWRRDRETTADSRVAAIGQWVSLRLGDAEGVAILPSVRRLLSTGLPSPVAGSGADLVATLTSLVSTQGASRAFLVDASLRLAARDTQPGEIEPGCLDAARAVLASGVPEAGFHRHANGDVATTFAAPVRDAASVGAPGPIVGVVVVAEDAGRWLYPYLSLRLGDSRTGEALLVRRESDGFRFLSPLRHDPAPPLTLRRPLNFRGLPADAALSRHERFGEYKDYRGVAVLAALRRVPSADWALVTKVDVMEALSSFRTRMWRDASTAGGALLGVAGLGLLARRAQRASQAADIARAQVRANERFKVAAESMSDVVYEWDLGDRIDWHGDVDGLTGYPPGEYPRTAEGWIATLHPEDRDRVAAITRRHLQEPGPLAHDVEYRVTRKDGTIAHWRARGRLIRDAGGRPVCWIGAITDVSERRRMEERLRESERRFRELIEALPILSWTCSPEGPCDYLSPQWVSYTGVPEGQQLGYGWLDQLHPDDRERTITAWQQAAPHGLGFDLDFRIRRADGHYRWFKTRAVPLSDSHGRLTKWFGSNTDVDDMKQAQQNLARTLEDLKRSNAELEQFAYVASHDLQEPLRMVSSYTQLLAQRYQGKLDADADDFIAFAVDGANRMQRQINDLLAYSRVGTRGKPPAPTDSHAALGVALANLTTVIGETGAIVTNDDLPTVLADESQLVLVFQNLIGNGVKFHRPNEPPRVHVSARRDGAMWAFAVRDSGIGIPPELRSRLFAIFQRLHTREEYSGTGIGLAICKRIVERLGGRIGIEAEPGQGTTLVFTLPAAEGTTS